MKNNTTKGLTKVIKFLENLKVNVELCSMEIEHENNVFCGNTIVVNNHYIIAYKGGIIFKKPNYFSNTFYDTMTFKNQDDFLSALTCGILCGVEDEKIEESEIVPCGTIEAVEEIVTVENKNVPCGTIEDEKIEENENVPCGTFNEIEDTKYDINYYYGQIFDDLKVYQSLNVKKLGESQEKLCQLRNEPFNPTHTAIKHENKLYFMEYDAYNNDENNIEIFTLCGRDLLKIKDISLDELENNFYIENDVNFDLLQVVRIEEEKSPIVPCGTIGDVKNEIVPCGTMEDEKIEESEIVTTYIKKSNRGSFSTLFASIQTISKYENEKLNKTQKEQLKAVKNSLIKAIHKLKNLVDENTLKNIIDSAKNDKFNYKNFTQHLSGLGIQFV